VKKHSCSKVELANLYSALRSKLARLRLLEALALQLLLLLYNNKRSPPSQGHLDQASTTKLRLAKDLLQILPKMHQA